MLNSGCKAHNMSDGNTASSCYVLKIKLIVLPQDSKQTSLNLACLPLFFHLLSLQLSLFRRSLLDDRPCSSSSSFLRQVPKVLPFAKSSWYPLVKAILHSGTHSLTGFKAIEDRTWWQFMRIWSAAGRPLTVSSDFEYLEHIHRFDLKL
jgi:hypothetical protein